MSNPSSTDLSDILAPLTVRATDLATSLATITKAAIQLAQASNDITRTVAGWLVLQAAADAMAMAMSVELSAEEMTVCIQMHDAIFSALEEMRDKGRDGEQLPDLRTNSTTKSSLLN